MISREYRAALMKAPIKLAGFGAALAVVLGASLWAGATFVPRNMAASWSQAMPGHGAGHDPGHNPGRGGPPSGVSLSDGNVMLSALTAPALPGTPGALSFRIATIAGIPVTKFDTENTKQLHLIVVRNDGAEYRHVHPAMNADGQWSIPWTWDAAGTYRVFADFVPTESHKGTVLSSSIDVAGTITPRTVTPNNVSQVDGFSVTIDGTTRAQTASMLTATITRDGQPVTTLQPYLGADGHLVALRDGDLAYLHAHPDAPAGTTAGSVRGPKISFYIEPPTPGIYLLYLDFQVDGRVHTAQFAQQTQQ